MPEQLSAAAVVVLRDGDDTHPRDVNRNAVKALAAAVPPDRPAGGRFWTNAERGTFDAQFDRHFEIGFDER